MKDVVGKMLRVKAPKAAGAQLRRPQMEGLTEFSTTLHGGLIVGVHADVAEHGLEGPYWLARLSGPAFVIPEDMVRAGHQYRQGWLVAPGQWYASPYATTQCHTTPHRAPRIITPRLAKPHHATLPLSLWCISRRQVCSSAA